MARAALVADNDQLVTLKLAAVYFTGQDPQPPLGALWLDPAGAPYDLSGVVLDLTVSHRGGAPVITKSAGIVGTASVVDDAGNLTPNVTVTWSFGELTGVDPGDYVLELVEVDGPHGPIKDFGTLTVRAPGPSWGYCEVGDLIMGDETIGPNLDRQRFVNNAADEIDRKLGRVYIVPVNTSDPNVPDWVKLELRTINIKIASGRIVMAMQNNERWGLQYGQELVKEGEGELATLLQGELPGVPKNGEQVLTGPAVINYDQTSPVDAFERFISGDRCARWNAGPTVPARPWGPR